MLKYHNHRIYHPAGLFIDRHGDTYDILGITDKQIMLHNMNPARYNFDFGYATYARGCHNEIAILFGTK